MEPIELKKLKSDLPREIDNAFDQHASSSGRWASYVRLSLGIVFLFATVVRWSLPDSRKYLYLGLSIAWLLAFIVVRWRTRQGASKSLVTLTTLIDITIANFGLLFLALLAPSTLAGSGLFLCYFPLVAAASTRYRPGLVLSAGIYASAFYAITVLITQGNPWFRVAALMLTTLVCAFGTRKPKDLMIGSAGGALQEAFNLGMRRREIELNARFHEALFPAPIIDLPSIWSSSKHSAGSQTSGDYYQVFTTSKGPLVVIGDLGGEGPDAIRDIAQLNQTFVRVVLEQATLAGILENVNAYLNKQYSGKRRLTCILARWEGEVLEYANAGHLPALHLHKEGRTRLVATCAALGEREDAQFSSTTMPFPPRDLLLLFTDGLYAKLTTDRQQGIAEVEGLADRFCHGEVNTICHRVFDCALPGLEEPTDDCTLVVVRRQPRGAGESKAVVGGQGSVVSGSLVTDH